MSQKSACTIKTEFQLNAPKARSVTLVADFTAWEQSPVTLKKQKNGLWKTTVSLAPGRYEYRFLVDGQWQDDPLCPLRSPNPYGADNCVRMVEAKPAGKSSSGA